MICTEGPKLGNKKVYLMLKEAVLQALDNSRELSDEELMESIEAELARRDKRMLLPFGQRRQYAKALFASFRKFGVIQELVEDDEVTEISVNGASRIFYEKAGELKRFAGSFAGEEELSDFIQSVCAGGSRMVNEASPIVDTRLPDGSRVNIVLNPISIDGPAISIRKFPKDPICMETLLAYGSLSAEIALFLGKLVIAGYNIFVSGGTGSGKTSFLNALSQFIPKEERVITIEDSAELKLNGIENLVRLETRTAGFDGVEPVTIRDLIRTALRMRPDRVLVGECRGEEALDLLSANNTGHCGSMGTGHANSAYDMISRLETMALMGADLPVSAIRGQIVSGIDIFVHLGRIRDKSRKLLEIAELDGLAAGEVRLNILYRFVETGEEEGKVQGRWDRIGALRHKEKWEAAGF
ncbi:MAG: CpaF family protein [Eubacterium sp.]|nr:CpaF family protein [Eubacterium sp.]NBI86761.1 CpaF family protein [Lachnospiraceae bacterium]